MIIVWTYYGKIILFDVEPVLIQPILIGFRASLEKKNNENLFLELISTLFVKFIKQKQ